MLSLSPLSEDVGDPPPHASKINAVPPTRVIAEAFRMNSLLDVSIIFSSEQLQLQGVSLFFLSVIKQKYNKKK